MLASRYRSSSYDTEMYCEAIGRPLIIIEHIAKSNSKIITPSPSKRKLTNLRIRQYAFDRSSCG